GQTAEASLELQLADVGSISGVVTSADNGARLADVEVTLHGTPYRTATAADGTFSFSLIEPGDYELELEVAGHVRSLVPVTVTAGQTTHPDVALRVSPRVGIIDDSTSANSRDRGKEFLADWGYLPEDIGFDSLDRIPDLDLVIANVADFQLDISFAQFKAFEDAVNRAGVPVLWMGQHERGAIRFLQRYDGNPTEVGQGINAEAVTATVVADHPLVAGLPEQFELLDRGTRYSYVNGYDGQVVATLSTADTGEVGAAIAYRGRTAGTVDVMLSTMSISTWGAPSTREVPAVKWTPQAERVLVNALAWALDARGLAAEVRGTVDSDLGGRIPSQVTVLETGRTYQGRSGDGSFLVPLRPGTWTLQVASFGHAAQTFEVTVAAGGVESVALQRAAEPAGAVTGTGPRPDGSGLSGATVSIVDTPLVTTTGPGGAFALERVPPGEWTVRVTADGHVAAEVPATVVAGQVTTVPVVMRPSPTVALVDVSATGANGRALADMLRAEGYEVDQLAASTMAALVEEVGEHDLIIFNG